MKNSSQVLSYTIVLREFTGPTERCHHQQFRPPYCLDEKTSKLSILNEGESCLKLRFAVHGVEFGLNSTTTLNHGSYERTLYQHRLTHQSLNLSANPEQVQPALLYTIERGIGRPMPSVSLFTKFRAFTSQTRERE